MIPRPLSDLEVVILMKVFGDGYIPMDLVIEYQEMRFSLHQFELGQYPSLTGNSHDFLHHEEFQIDLNFVIYG